MLQMQSGPSGIAGRTGTAPGAGVGKEYTWDGTDLFVDGLAEDQEVLNPYTGAVGNSRFMWVVEKYGRKWVLTDDCPPPSGSL